MELDLFNILCEGMGLYIALWSSIWIICLGSIATLFVLVHFSGKDE